LHTFALPSIKTSGGGELRPAKWEYAPGADVPRQCCDVMVDHPEQRWLRSQEWAEFPAHNDRSKKASAVGQNGWLEFRG
jgi:hypothetical protein